MKPYIFITILTSVFFSSCLSQQRHPTIAQPYPSVRLDVYYRPYSRPSTYFIFHKNPNFYTLYYMTYASMLGDWTKRGDTLLLFPYTEYYASGGKLSSVKKIVIDSIEDYTIVNIPRRYLVKGDTLIDITDYEVLFDFPIARDIFTNENSRENFVRLKRNEYLPVFP